MKDLEDILKRMTNKTKGIVLIGMGIVLCLGGFLLADGWAYNADLLFNIKNSYITIFQDPRAFTEIPLGQSRTVRMPFSIIFFISSILFLAGCALLAVDGDKKR